MAYLLDTNVAITALNKSDVRVSDKLLEALSGGLPVILSSIVLFELRFGVSNSHRPELNEERLEKFLSATFIQAPFEFVDAVHAGDIRAHLRRAGTPIGPYDVLIAAQARRRGATLVTANTAEFSRVPGLVLENWAAP